MRGFSLEHYLLATIAFALVVIGVVIGVVIYQDLTSPVFEIKKDDWACTEEHQESHTRLVPIDKTLIPITDLDTVCDRYERRKP